MVPKEENSRRRLAHGANGAGAAGPSSVLVVPTPAAAALHATCPACAHADTPCLTRRSVRLLCCLNGCARGPAASRYLFNHPTPLPLLLDARGRARFGAALGTGTRACLRAALSRAFSLCGAFSLFRLRQRGAGKAGDEEACADTQRGNAANDVHKQFP